MMFFRGEWMHYECSTFDHMCSKLGPAMGVLMLHVWVFQWTIEGAVSWHQKYEFSGIMVFVYICST